MRVLVVGGNDPACLVLRGVLCGVAIMVMGVSALASIAEARHRHHHGHYSPRHSHRGVERAARYARPPVPVSLPSNQVRASNGTGGFADGIRRMVGACDDQVAEMKGMPFDAVSRTVSTGENQRNALEQIRSITSTAADTLSVACPKDIPAPLSQRLDTLGVALGAINASLATLRPAFATFYDTLDDEQKAMPNKDNCRRCGRASTP